MLAPCPLPPPRWSFAAPTPPKKNINLQNKNGHLFRKALPKPERRPKPDVPAGYAELLRDGRGVVVLKPREAPAGLPVTTPLAAGAKGGFGGGGGRAAAEAARYVGRVVNEGYAVQHPAHRDVGAGGGDEERYLRVLSGASISVAVAVAVAVNIVVNVVRRKGERGQERSCSRLEPGGRGADVEGVRL